MLISLLLMRTMGIGLISVHTVQEFFQCPDGQSDHGLPVAIYILHEMVLFILEGIGAGLIRMFPSDLERFPESDPPELDLADLHRACRFKTQRVDDRQARINAVSFPGKFHKHICGVPGRSGFAEDFAVQDDHGVRADDKGLSGLQTFRHGFRFLDGKPSHETGRGLASLSIFRDMA